MGQMGKRAALAASSWAGLAGDARRLRVMQEVAEVSYYELG